MQMFLTYATVNDIVGWPTAVPSLLCSQIIYLFFQQSSATKARCSSSTCLRSKCPWAAPRTKFVTSSDGLEPEWTRGVLRARAACAGQLSLQPLWWHRHRNARGSCTQPVPKPLRHPQLTNQTTPKLGGRWAGTAVEEGDRDTRCNSAGVGGRTGNRLGNGQSVFLLRQPGLSEGWGLPRTVWLKQQ